MEDSDDLYPWRRCIMRRITKTGLPGIQGVYPLSKFEVKKDVQEMERAANSDTETDSSIISEDILNSTYPVKPRKTPRGPIIPTKSASLKASHVEPPTPDCDGISVEQALSFLDVISRSESSLKAVEYERESFEIQAMSYRCRIDERSKSFHAIKKEQSNYMRAMQGFNSQALRLQMSLKRQNMMLFDVYTVLQRRQKASDSILAEAASLQAVIENQRCPESISSPSCHVATLNVIDVVQAETSTLRITLPRSKEEIVLYKGQCVRTPMGEAFVLCIIPGVEKVVLQLSFGKMYVTVRQMVVWGREKRLNQLDELLTVDSLRQKWTSMHITGGLIVPSDVRNAIQALAGQGDDEPATDGDEDSANDDSNLLDNILDDSSSSSMINMKGNLNILEECSGQSAQATHILHASSACNGGSNSVFSSTVRCATDNNTHWSDCSFPLKGYPSDAPSSSSTPSSSSSSSAAAPLSRQALKNILSLQGMEDCQDQTASSALPYIFTPPGAMPYIVELEQNLESTRVRFCPDALAENVRIGSVGSMVWKGDLNQMRRELISMQNDVMDLENEQNMYIGNVRDVRSQCALLSADTAALRLRSFTRRIRHRNALNDHNNVTTSTSLLDNTRHFPYPPGVDGTVQLISLPEPLSVPLLVPVPVQLTLPVEASIRKRSGSGEVEGNNKPKSLRGSLAIVKDITSVKGGTRNVNVFFTGACLTRETLGQDPEDQHLPPSTSTSTSTSASTPIPSPGQDITDTLPVKVCSTRRRNRDVTEELSLPLPSRRRVATPAVTGTVTGTGTGTGTGELTRVVSGKELARVIMSKIYENDIKCDENNVEIEIQGEGDLDLEERRSEESAGKGTGAGAFTLDTVQGGGISKRKAKRPKRY